MIDFRRRLAPAAQALAASVLVLSLAAAPAALARTSDSPPPPAVWVQDRTDVRPDPALRFGVLPNGMRYVLMHGATPPQQAALRLRLDVGSMMEKDNEAGLAHFIEHMAFDGSTHVKPHEMVKILERHGLAFGADTNASTSWNETIYQLDLPKTDAETLDTGLFLLRETAGELAFDKAALETERGVVLSEERLRDGPGMHVFHKDFDYLFPGQLTPRRFPIGDVKVIKTAPRDRLVSLYHRYYRPDRAVLVAVGDFDLDQMEQLIRTKFSDWKPVGPAGEEPVIGALNTRATETKLVVEPGAPSSVEIDWLSPPELDRDSTAYRRQQFVRALGFQVLNRRFERISRGTQPPFIAAGAGRVTELKTADVVKVRASLDPTHFPDAIHAIETEVKRATQYGVTPVELEREISEMRSTLRAAAEGESTRKTPDVANEIVGNIGEREVPTSPAQDLALFEETVKGLDIAQVSAELKAEFSGAGPLVFAVSPTAPAGGETAIAKAFDTARLAEVSPPANETTKAWAYADFGKAGKVTEIRQAADLDTSFYRFENGVRLTVKPTKFRKNQILVWVRGGAGRLSLPRDRVAQTWALGSTYAEGGLKDLTRQEMEQVLNGKVYGAGFGVSDDAFTLFGETRPEDLSTQMQVLAAYLTNPGWRPDAWTRMQTYGQTLQHQYEASPGGVFSREGAALLRSGDKRWVFPSPAEIAGGKLDDLKQLVSGELATGPLEVIIVGDITPDEAAAQTGLTFGALPPRGDGHLPSAEARTLRFPAPTPAPVHLTHKGRADQALGYIAWPTVDFVSDPQRARQVRMLQLVLQLRLIDVLRTAQGVTYSPQTDYRAEWDYPGYGYVAAMVEAPPEKLDGFFRDVETIAKDLRDKPISDDELKRAMQPRIEQIEKAKETNEFWLNSLAGGQADPRKLDAIRSAVAGLQRVTPAQIQAAAQAYLRDDKAWKLEITPEQKVAAQ
jgi:zinc protease